jgi:hypothetical protein
VSAVVAFLLIKCSYFLCFSPNKLFCLKLVTDAPEEEVQYQTVISVVSSPLIDCVLRNGTKRWKYAQSGREESKAVEELSVVIHATTLDLDLQKSAVEIANQALDTLKLESEVATFVKARFDEIGNKSL